MPSTETIRPPRFWVAAAKQTLKIHCHALNEKKTFITVSRDVKHFLPILNTYIDLMAFKQQKNEFFGRASLAD